MEMVVGVAVFLTKKTIKLMIKIAIILYLKEI